MKKKASDIIWLVLAAPLIMLVYFIEISYNTIKKYL